MKADLSTALARIEALEKRVDRLDDWLCEDDAFTGEPTVPRAMLELPAQDPIAGHTGADYPGRRVAVHMKTGAFDEIRGGVWGAWDYDGRAIIKLDKAGKIACAADEWVLLPEGWVP